MKRQKKTTFGRLKGAARRRCHKLLARVREKGVVFVSREHEYRDAERLHQTGLVIACVSKKNLIGRPTGRPFKELALHATEDLAKRGDYARTMLPRPSRKLSA